MHEDCIQEYLPKKLEMKQNLEMLKFISYVTPLLIALKKRMKIPDINKLLNPPAGIPLV
jgi:hypothetical protein